MRMKKKNVFLFEPSRQALGFIPCSFFPIPQKMTRPAPQPLPVARIVGAAAVGKKRLVRALLAQQRSSSDGAGATQGGDGESSCSAPIADDADGAPLDQGCSPSSSPRSSLWELDTRYYTATLSLERSRIDEEGDKGSAAAVETEEEAVVLVFDPARERTFAAAARWWSSRAPSGSEDLREPAVKLCVAHGEDGGEGDSDSERSLRREAEAWCVENAFELIEVHFSSSSSSSSLSPCSSSSEGISRLRDALAAHVWPGLVRKAPGEVEAARRAAVAEAERRRRRKGGGGGGGAAGGEEEEEEGKDEEEEGAYAPPLPPPLADDEDLLLPSGFEAACRGAAGVEGLEELFRSLSAARAAAVASSALSDDERRERAAAVALRLAEALAWTTTTMRRRATATTMKRSVVGGGARCKTNSKN